MAAPFCGLRALQQGGRLAPSPIPSGGDPQPVGRPLGRAVVARLCELDQPGRLPAGQSSRATNVPACARECGEHVRPVSRRLAHHLRGDGGDRHPHIAEARELRRSRVLINARLLIDEIQRLGEIFLAQKAVRQVAYIRRLLLVC